MATLQQAMTVARSITNDTNASEYAKTDAVLLQHANNALDAIAAVKPSLFHSVAEVTCIANTSMQTFNITDSLGLVDVLNIKNGSNVTLCDRGSLDVYVPGWRSMTSAPAEHWIPVPNDPFRFEVYPPAPSGQVLMCIHVKKPLEYAATEVHVLPDSYTHIIADYIVAMIDSTEDEYAVSGRAAQYMSSFYSKLGISKAA